MKKGQKIAEAGSESKQEFTKRESEQAYFQKWVYHKLHFKGLKNCRAP